MTPGPGGPKVRGPRRLCLSASKSKNRLKEVRFNRGIKQLNLALKTGINPAIISKIENNWFQPTKKQAEKLSQVLRVPPEWLFPELGDQTETKTSE